MKVWRDTVTSGAMDPELGVLLALLLRSSPGFEETYQRLIQDLVQNNCLPRRIGWTGEEEDYDISDLVLLIFHRRPVVIFMTIFSQE